jgi:hypothetical protein
MITKKDLAKAILELKESQAETDKQIKEIHEKLKSMDILLGDTSNNQYDLTETFFDNSLSDSPDKIAESFFYNLLANKPTLAGINYDLIEKNPHRSNSKIKDEYDIFLVNSEDIAIIEVKYKAHESDVERLITKKYENFKILYPKYKNHNHHLGLASFNINKSVKDMALKNNVILLQRKGDLIETIIAPSK